MRAMAAERVFTCNLCEAACGLSLAIDGERVTRLRGDPDDVLSGGHICPKAIGLRELLEDPDRLRAPVRRTPSGWKKISWDEAFDQSTTRLGEIRGRFGSDAVALYVGNPVVHSHRASLGSQLLSAALGTKNRFDPNSQDSNPRLFACMRVYGDGLSIPVPDIERTDFLLMLGANPAVSNGSQMVLGNPVARFRRMRERGARIVLIDPRRSESASWCTSHHFIRPGGDAALLLAILNVVLSEGRGYASDVSRVATGVVELEQLAARFPPERVSPAVGIDAEAIRALARDFASARRAVAYARVGVCQNEFGPVAAWLVEALNIVTGNFDREGGALFPTPAVDIAPLGRLLVGNNYARWRSRVRGLPEFLGALPSATMAEEMETPGDGQIRALVCMAGNPVLSTPNGARVDRALAGLDFMLAVDFYVNETTRHADVILPPQHVFETGNYDIVLSRFGVRNVAKYSAPALETSDDTLDDWQIATELALRLKAPAWARSLGRRLARGLPERALDLLLRTGPHKLSLNELRAAPHGLDLGPLQPDQRSRYVTTPDGFAQLAPGELVADVPRVERWLDEVSSRGLVLIGRRSLRSNNSWMHNLTALAKGPDRARLLMHPNDASSRGLADGGAVRVKSRTGTIDATLSVTDEVMPGVVSLPHGFGHQAARSTLRVAGALPGASANSLTDELLVEPVVGTSILNGVPVSVEPSDA
jgi:anaerobic selenocysteine-containing dehydrogenase